MATLKVNIISKSSGNNVAMQDSLNLKSYTTTEKKLFNKCCRRYDIQHNRQQSTILQWLELEMIYNVNTRNQLYR